MNVTSKLKKWSTEVLKISTFGHSDTEVSLTEAVLENQYVKQCFRKIIEKYYMEDLNSVIAESVLLTSDNYPSLSEVYSCCCHELGITDVPEIYVTRGIRGINALSIQHNEKKQILIGRMTLLMLDTEELKFLLGHELGHHMQGNIESHLLNGIMHSVDIRLSAFGTPLPDMLNIPLKKWCRESEFKADIAGFRCCKDIKVVERLFARIAPDERNSMLNKYRELSYDHPLFITRLEKLKEYINTQK